MAVNVALLIWGQLSFILGICGNVFVLYATIFHNAIKLDKMSIWIIKNLAVVDLCNCFFVLVPAISNQYSEGKWFFGSGTCYVYAVNVYTFLVANAFLINVLSINKLMRCKYPLRNVNSSKRQRILVSLCTVIFSFSLMIWNIVALSRDLFSLIENDEMTSLKTCTTRKSKGTSIIFCFILATVYDGIPCLTLVTTTTILMIYAIKKSKRPINKKNVLTVILVTATFLLSFLPYMIFIAANIFPEKIEGKLLDRFYEWTWSFTFLSSWTNPIIYLTMNKSFRDFTRNAICFRLQSMW